MFMNSKAYPATPTPRVVQRGLSNLDQSNTSIAHRYDPI